MDDIISEDGIEADTRAASSNSIAAQQSVTSVKPSQNFIAIATPSISVSTIGSVACRICHANRSNEKLISPCKCKGSLAYVHLSCLERWLNQASRSYCELCMYRFNSIQTPRYNVCESLRLWIRHPRNRQHVQSDILICVLLSIVTLGLVAVCVIGMEYFILEGIKMGISKAWTRGTISFFLGMVVTGYVLTIYLLVKDQLLPWYIWWKNTVDVKLLLPAPITGENTNLNSNWRETAV